MNNSNNILIDDVFNALRNKYNLRIENRYVPECLATIYYIFLDDSDGSIKYLETAIKDEEMVNNNPSDIIAKRMSEQFFGFAKEEKENTS